MGYDLSFFFFLAFPFTCFPSDFRRDSKDQRGARIRDLVCRLEAFKNRYKKSQSWETYSYVYLLTHKIIYVQASYRWSYNAVCKGLFSFTADKGMASPQVGFLFRCLVFPIYLSFSE